jgi:hypothetical protein
MTFNLSYDIWLHMYAACQQIEFAVAGSWALWAAPARPASTACPWQLRRIGHPSEPILSSLGFFLAIFGRNLPQPLLEPEGNWVLV